VGSIGGIGAVPVGARLPDWELLAIAVLAAGVLMRTGWLLLGAARLRGMRARSRSAIVEPDVDALRIALAPRAEFRTSDEVGQPVMFGLRHPVILLPPRWFAMTVDERRAVACHELLHVARHDWPWIVVEEHVRSLCWFHPAVWWLLEQIQVSREQLIDRLVVAQLGAKRAYMSALIRFADNAGVSPSTAFLRRRHLRSRLRLLSQESSMSPKRLAWTAAVLTLVVSGTTAGVARVLPLEIPGPSTQTGQPPRLEIRLAEDNPGAGLTEAVVSGETRRVYLHATTLATNADVTDAAVVGSADSQFGVAVTFDRGAAGRVAAATRAHVGRPLAIIVNGQVVAVLAVRAEIGGRAVISGNFTAEQARALADGLAPAGRQGAVTNPAGRAVVMPVLLTQVRPAYTEAAMAARVEGVVVMRAVVLADGSVGEVAVTKSLDAEHGLDDSAVAALRQWRFRPGTKDGMPVAVQVIIETQFTLRK
jgi:TonB family protein